MNIEIYELTESDIDKYNIIDFIFDMIKVNYGLDYVPEYHYDVIDIVNYYIKPERNNFFIAIDTENDKLVGTIAVRGYDKDYYIQGKNYTVESTASIYRMFVDSEYRHNKIASKLFKTLEDFCMKKGYDEIYLHTQKESYGALPFWLNNDFEITYDTHNELGTIHMEKIIASK